MPKTGRAYPCVICYSGEYDRTCLVFVDDEAVLEMLRTYTGLDVSLRRGSNVFMPRTRGAKKKMYVMVRKMLGMNKKEFCDFMGWVGGSLSLWS